MATKHRGSSGSEPDRHNHLEAEEFFRIFRNLADFAIFTVDGEGRITSWNVGAQNVFGYEPAEILGKPLAKVFTHEDRLAHQVEWEIDYARKEGRADDERWHLRKNGETFWASGVLSATRDKDGNVTGFVKVVRDLTIRKRAEDQRDRVLQELQHESQAKDRFLATLSHELRTPLAAILGWISLLRERRLRPEQVETALESAYRNAVLQKGLIDDLLDISRITAGQLKLNMQAIDLRQIARRALDSVRFMAGAKHIELDSVLEETVAPIMVMHGGSSRFCGIFWRMPSSSLPTTAGLRYTCIVTTRK